MNVKQRVFRFSNALKQSVIFALLLSLSSCWSYRTTCDASTRSAFATAEKQLAYVTNPSEHPYACDVLTKSEIYTFTKDSLSPIKINLLPADRFLGPHCLTSQLTVLAFTLGQYPVKSNRRVRINFTELNSGNEERKEFVLEYEKRIWFWDMFSLKKSEKRAISKQLRHAWFTEDHQFGEK